MASYTSLLVPSRVLVNRCITSCVLFLYVGSLHAAILDEVIVPSSLDPMIEYITGNLDTPTPITPVALEIPEATRSALDDRDMTIAQVDDTVVVTTSTGVTLDDTTLSGAIAEVTVAIAADTEIISEDRGVFAVESLAVTSTEDISEIIAQTGEPVEEIISDTRLVEFGVAGEHLIFSRPVRMEVAVDGEEGLTIEIGVRHAGDAEFGSEGITSSADATCTDGVSSDEDSAATITDGHVVFYTCGASAFLLKAGGAGALRFWVRGNKGITTSGTAVTKWDDVGKGNLDLVNATVAARPVIANGVNQINFNNAVRFGSVADGTADFLTNGTTNKRDSTIVNNTTYQGAHYIVFRPTTAVYGTVWQKNPNAGKFTGIKNGNYKHSDTVVSIGTVPVNKPSIVGGLINRAAGATTSVVSTYTNGVFVASGSATNHANTNSLIYIGNNDAKNEPFSGDIAELLLYNLPHTATLRQQVESYLAIKWGITLSQVTPRSYVLNNGTSAGTITAWDATTGGIYKNDIMGLARSDNKSSGGYTLDQRKSKSQNPGTDILTIGTYSNIRLPANNRTIMVAHDGGALAEQATELPVSPLFTDRLTREWKVQERNGDTQGINLSFDLSGSSISPSPRYKFRLMLDADGDFSNATVSTKQATLSGTVLTFKNINLANNQYFALITSYNFDLSIDETIPLLTATNRPSYPVSGTCTSTAGDVTLTIKGVNYIVACTAGIYSTNLNLASLSLGVNYEILATQISPINGPVTVASTILAIPNISKSFSLGYKKTATPVTLTWNIDNRSETALSAWSITDALPAGMVVAPTPNTISDCLGTFAGAGAGSTSVSYSATSLPIDLPIDLPMCSISIDVQSSTAGTYVNSASNVTVTGPLYNAVTPQTVIFGLEDLILPVITWTDNVAVGPTAGLDTVVLTVTDSGGATVDSQALLYTFVDFVADCDPLVTDFTGVTDAYTSGKALYFNDMSLNTTYLCVQAKDKAGNATYATAANPFNFAPDVTAPLGAITTTGSTSRSPDLVGTVDDPTASVYIDIAGGTYLATNNTDGTWTLTANNISPELVPGTTYPIQITLVDNAANTTIIAGSLTIIADTIPPVTPTLTSFAASGATLSSPTPTFAGTAEPGTTITITDGSGTIIADTIVNPDGSFTVTLAIPLSEGTHTLSVASIDLDGNISFVLIVIVVIDISLPAAPVVLTPLAGATLTTTTPTFAGTAEPGSTITVIDGSGGIVGTALTDGSGSYTLTLSLPLPNGAVSLSITATDIAGNVSAPTASYSYTIAGIAAPTIPTVTNPSATGSWNPTAPIVGTGTPGAIILITDGSGTVIGSGVVDAAGSYSILTTATESTPTPIVIAQCDPLVPTSCTVSSAPLTLTIDTTPPITPTTPGTLGGDSTSPFATADATPTITGSGAPGDTMTIKDGSGNTIGTATIDASGSYSLTLTAALPDGIQTLSLTATDMAGNASIASTMVISIDLITPDTLLMTTSPTGLSGSFTLSRSIALGFLSTETGSTYQCAIDIGAYTGCTSPYGHLFTTDGPHTIRVRSIDPVGNIDPTPLTIGFTLYSSTSGGVTPSPAPAPAGTNTPALITPSPSPAPVVTPTKPPKINTPKAPVAVVSLPKAPIFVESPPPSTLAILSAQDNNVSFVAKLAGTTYLVYELKDRVTDTICPRIVKMYDESSLQATDISRTDFSEDIHSVLMFRGLEQGEEASGATFTAYRRSAIALNDRSFEPTRSVTRAEFVKMLVRSLSCRYTFSGTDSGFSDVDTNMWYAEYITFGVKNGWIDGYSDGKFHPNAPITRAEAAKILARAIELTKPKTTTTIFDDVPDTNIFAPYIESLQDAGIFRGRTDTIFAPDQYIPRTEVSRIIYRTFLGGQR